MENIIFLIKRVCLKNCRIKKCGYAFYAPMEIWKNLKHKHDLLFPGGHRKRLEKRWK